MTDTERARKVLEEIVTEQWIEKRELAMARALLEIVEEIDKWRNAYPTDIFPEMTRENWKDAQVALKDVGFVIDRISASNMRHVAKCIGEKVDAAIAEIGKEEP